MRLSSLKTYQFRNGSSAIEGPFSLFNGIFGPNTRGKTNFLEAIYYISHLKSWRVSHKRDLIQFGRDEGAIRAEFETGERTHEVLIRLFPEHREVIVDGKAIRSWASYGPNFVAILFSPEDAYLFRESPSRRRNYIDQMLYHDDHGYWSVERAYRRVIESKNALLKDGRLDTLPVWNEQLVDYGSDILVRRYDYLSAIQPFFQRYYSRIVSGQGARETISMTYTFLDEDLPIDGTLSKEAWRDRLLFALEKERAQECRRKTALVGPHRDDWTLYLDGQAVSVSASQGEHRSLVMALKLAEVAILRERLGEAPIFLVDDLSSELDANRRRFLIDTLLETECQTFLTSTDIGLFIDSLPKDKSRLFEI